MVLPYSVPLCVCLFVDSHQDSLHHQMKTKKINLSVFLSFFHSCSGGSIQSSFCYQIFLDETHNLILPTVQQLIEQSFYSGHLKLAEVRPLHTVAYCVCAVCLSVLGAFKAREYDIKVKNFS